MRTKMKPGFLQITNFVPGQAFCGILLFGHYAGRAARPETASGLTDKTCRQEHRRRKTKLPQNWDRFREEVTQSVIEGDHHPAAMFRGLIERMSGSVLALSLRRLQQLLQADGFIAKIRQQFHLSAEHRRAGFDAVVRRYTRLGIVADPMIHQNRNWPQRARAWTGNRAVWGY